ncbi:hypothetical protein [Thalassoglobus polymorphus]|uniref:Phospholipase/Carboxylesterase n=1 Tax=Thalassoglobus polymorphus TaxID=2527994 RepID=A0A517QJ55_9PLAN|nr:hypothetical protein [Thalassoglobus polymorphus]QDT31656.1 hypothetical protein Mal48_08910 [Thalassoglobus polymorphus]
MGLVEKHSSSVSVEHPVTTCVTDVLFDSSYSLYITENFTETYSYPLVTYLHDGSRSERDLWNWFPSISDQNYLGLGVRASFPHPRGLPGQFDWKLRRPDASMASIRDAVYSVDRDWAINPQKIYLFGEGDGAIVALQHLVLQQSLEFETIFAAGAICRSLPKNWADWLPHITNQLHGRILFLDPIQNPDEQAAIDALSEAGLEITFAHASEEVPPPQIINQWIMAGINTAIF